MHKYASNYINHKPLLRVQSNNIMYMQQNNYSFMKRGKKRIANLYVHYMQTAYILRLVINYSYNFYSMQNL